MTASQGPFRLVSETTPSFKQGWFNIELLTICRRFTIKRLEKRLLKNILRLRNPGRNELGEGLLSQGGLGFKPKWKQCGHSLHRGQKRPLSWPEPELVHSYWTEAGGMERPTKTRWPPSEVSVGAGWWTGHCKQEIPSWFWQAGRELPARTGNFRLGPERECPQVSRLVHCPGSGGTGSG